MVAKTRLPGPRAFRRSRVLAKTLETSLETFADVSGMMRGNDELARFSRVRTIMDVSRAFTEERAETYRGNDDDDDVDSSSVIVDSLYTLDEARRALETAREGTVGIRVGRRTGEAFLRRGDGYDCVSHDATRGWSVRRGRACETMLPGGRSDEDLVADNDGDEDDDEEEEDAVEIVLLETVS